MSEDAGLTPDGNDTLNYKNTEAEVARAESKARPDKIKKCDMQDR